METEVITKVFENTTSKGQKFLVIIINEQRYSVFDDKLFEHCKEGTQVNFTFETKGEYKNITAMQPSAKEEKHGTTSPAFLGMVSNQAVNYCAQEQINLRSDEGMKSLNEIFERLWDFNMVKREQKNVK